MKNEDFLKKAFGWYYSKNKVPAPDSIENREFGIGSFGKKIDKRHFAFQNEKELNNFLRAEIPLYISYSCAYYKKPDATPMEAKGFLGSDLIYEFDADDFNEDCVDKHDRWSCKSCNAKGQGAPEKCPYCGGRVELDQWVCKNCLEKAKQNTLKLISWLKSDFGIDEGIYVNFSGFKGYHVHVRMHEIKNLKQNARVELVDYLTAHFLDTKSLGFNYQDGVFYCPAENSARGWQKKILLAIKNIFMSANYEELALATGITLSSAKRIIYNSDLVINSMKNGYLPKLFHKNEKFWNSLISYSINKEALPIDRQTSVDIKKIVRLPDSLHGATGLKASIVELRDIKNFDPLKNSIVFPEKAIKINVKSVPSFELNSKVFGPYENETVELPAYAAIYLIARNYATLGG
ncbi:MAG: hypothetical protein N3D73_01085 [Candidatus Diapherotrites archaeon]|nr:hypothetical protein [Candidatus Diapherotrites archaeon]